MIHSSLRPTTPALYGKDINLRACALAKATSPHIPMGPEELTLELGDLVAVLDMPDPTLTMWWKGKNRDQCGLFPYYCVEVMAQTQTPDHSKLIPVIGLTATNQRAVDVAVVIKAHERKLPGELYLQVGDLLALTSAPPNDHVWYGKADTFTIGSFPRQCVRVLTKDEVTHIDPNTINFSTSRASVPNSDVSLARRSHSIVQTTFSTNLKQESSGGRPRRFSNMPGTLGPTLSANNLSRTAAGCETMAPKAASVRHASLTVSNRPRSSSKSSEELSSGRGLIKKMETMFLPRSRVSTPLAVFGTPLKVCLELTMTAIPPVVALCLDEIERRKPVPGVYRASGSVKDIRVFRQALDMVNVDYDRLKAMATVQDVHVLASVVKAYFRELPLPLIGSEAYAIIMESVEESQSGCINGIAEAFKQLPIANRRLLCRLTEHLHWLAGHSDVTLMTAQSLAIVWSPNLFGERGEVGKEVDGEAMQRERKVVASLIENGPAVFESWHLE